MCVCVCISSSTCGGKRSPMTRISGPTISGTNGLSASSDVSCTSSPNPYTSANNKKGKQKVDERLYECLSLSSKTRGTFLFVRLREGQERRRKRNRSGCMKEARPAAAEGEMASREGRFGMWEGGDAHPSRPFSRFC